MFNLEKARARSWKIFNQEYANYENEDEKYLRKIEELCSSSCRVLDAGCGREMPFAIKAAPLAKELVGVDLAIDSRPEIPNLRAVESSLERLPFDDAYFDLVMSRSVLEHLPNPRLVFAEISRVLRPGGKFVFLIPNAWDYVSLISRMIPNRLHGFVVEKIEGRDPRDTFPTYYRANSVGSLKRLCRGSGMELLESPLLTQYPAYLMFFPPAFRLGIAYERLLREHEGLAWLRSWILGVARRVE